MSKSDNVVSELLGAIDTVVGKRLQQLPYDKTIICTIVDDSNAKNGEYKVSDGSVKFSAKCENANYRVDDQVRVSVPNGDTTQEKFILGKYVKNNSTTPITYMSPLSSVLQMSGNLCGSNSSIYGLQAKGTGAREEIMLWSASVDGTDMAMLGNAIYDILYVQADFKTILSNYNITSGTYGLELRLGTTLAGGQPGPAITCVYDSTQMMGNPYAFGIYTTQAAKFDITNISNITSMQLWFYQDGNFKHITHSPEPRPIPTDSDINNILIKNIQIGFGSDLQNVADETVKLFTTDSLFFDQTSKVNTKRLQFAWYNKDENGKYIGFDDGAFDEGYDEDDYLQRAGRNDALKAQKNYDIPMDEAGLRLAANVKSAKEILSVISTKLSVDLFELVNKFQARCNIAPYVEQFKNISNFITAQPMTETNGKTTLKDVVVDMHDWYMQALNMAAVKYNTNILPTQIEGEWQFKYQGTVPSSLQAPSFYDNLSDYFNDLEQLFYGIDVENPVFLGELLEYVTGDYIGYKGIYDDFNRRITKFFAEYRDEWERALELLNGGEDAIEAYFSSGYDFNPWLEEDLTTDANKYCIYWYRYAPNAEGDNFVAKGWQRIATNTVDTRNGISVNLDAITMAKEQFKVLVIFNHEKYESNVLTFENKSTVIPAGIATLSDRIVIKHGINSQESYQNYSSVNTLVNGSDRFVPRELSVELLQGESGTPNNSILQNAQIYWYVPDNATMLTFETVDLQKLNTENDFVNDIADSDKAADRQKVGYTCFYKTIGYGLAQAEDYVKDLKFCYRIKEYYVPTSTQNTIICEVVKDGKTYESEITMNFSSFGTSGTDYTLTVAPATKQAALTPSNTAENPWVLNISLYDNKNQEVDIPNITISNIVTNSRYYAEISLNENNKYQCQVSLEPESGTKNALCGILEFKIEDFQNVNGAQVALTMYHPIPYASNTEYYIEGASTVIYDSQGGNPAYYKDAYCLYEQDAADMTVDGTWRIQYAPGGSDGDSAWTTTKAYLPTLVNNALKPANMWVDGGDCTFNEAGVKTSHCAYVQCINASNEVLWSQPILILQNRYPSPMLNAWDGKFKIDEENGTIMSTMISAGKKNTDNTFSGVLMGDVEAAANLDNKTGLGIYGFNHGSQSFGLNVDGTAFFGKAGRGRILIDGNSGSISSASYEQNRIPIYDEDGKTIIAYQDAGTAGMMIDLDDGFIDMLGTTVPDANGNYSSNGTKSQIHLDVKSPYFYIKSKDGKELIHIGDEGNDLTPNYFLQTNDYQVSALWDDTIFNIDGAPGAGMKIDLAQGKIQAYNFELRGEDSRPIDDDHKTLGSYLHLSSTPEDMIRVHYRHNDFDTNGIDVLSVGSSSYILRSFNWWDAETGRDSTKIEPLTGMKIDLGAGTIEAYAENGADPLNWFRIDASDDSTVPLAIGDRTNPAFKVHWNGSFTINEENETQFAFKVDENGNLSLGSGKFKVDKDGNVAIGGYSDTNSNGQKDNNEHYAFFISQDGQLNIQGSNFQVTPNGDLSLGDGKFTVARDGTLAIAKESNTKYAFQVTNTGNLSLGSGAFQVSSNGQLTVGSNVFKVTPGGVLTVKETNADTYAFKVDANGNLSLGSGIFKVDSQGNLSLGKQKDSDEAVFFVSAGGELSINSGRFSVNNQGCLTVQPDKKDNTKVFRISDNGNLLLGSLDWDEAAFKVSNAGIMTAAGATLSNATVTGTLNVNSAFIMDKATEKFTVKSNDILIGASATDSNIHINGNTSIGSKGPTSPEAKTYRLYIDGKVGIGGETKVTGNLTTERGTVTLGGNTSVSGNLSFSGGVSSYVSSLESKDPYEPGSFPMNQYHSGIDGKIRITMEESGFWWWEGATEAYLIFAKGILVGIEKI